jgi:lipoprotein-releasing system ATP-binding protein
VLKGVDIEISKGEIVSIAGSSGAGKSTLLHILGTLDTADKGEILFNDKNISKLSGKKLAEFRNKYIGFVFQFHHLLPEFSALENICVPGWIAGGKNKDIRERALELLDLLNLKDRAEHKPGELSGGEQQRVAVARALINNPLIVMADEPTGNLDSANAQELHKLFIDLRDRFQQTFLIVTHNEELAKMSDRILHMKDGRII